MKSLFNAVSNVVRGHRIATKAYIDSISSESARKDIADTVGTVVKDFHASNILGEAKMFDELGKAASEQMDALAADIKKAISANTPEKVEEKRDEERDYSSITLTLELDACIMRFNVLKVRGLSRYDTESFQLDINATRRRLLSDAYNDHVQAAKNLAAMRLWLSEKEVEIGKAAENRAR